MTDVGALPNDWATDPVALARVLARLREWDPEPRRGTPGLPRFGATCRRAYSGDPPADLTLPGGDL
ncbi:MAG: hypothetical protein WAN20_24370 [Pseudonocardiaceae bacterium]